MRDHFKKEVKTETEKLCHTPSLSKKENKHDIIVISPDCYIFNDLAKAFTDIGLNTFLINIPHIRSNNQSRSQLVSLLQHHTSELIINRNRSAYEVRDPLSEAPLEPYIKTEKIQWWWDVPNIATMIDYETEYKNQINLAFAKDILPLLPIGSQWLPAGAQQRFCQPHFANQLEKDKCIDISFVGQSRVDLLKVNIINLFKMLSQLVDDSYEEAREVYHHLPNMEKTHSFLLDLQYQLVPTLQKLAYTHPKECYYIDYILKMCITGSLRLAAVQNLTEQGFNIAVYGDEGWVQDKIIAPAYYQGSIEAEELPNLFRHSKINLNLNFMQVSSTINPKVLDILACGGIVLSDYRPEIDTLYPEQHLRPFTFHFLEELPERVASLLDRDLSEYSMTMASHTQTHHSMQERARWIIEHFYKK